MKKDKVVCEENISYLMYYDMLNSVFKNHQKDYPNNVRKKFKNLLKEMDNLLNHKKDGYEIVDEKFESETTFSHDEPDEIEEKKKGFFSLFRR